MQGLCFTRAAALLISVIPGLNPSGGFPYRVVASGSAGLGELMRTNFHLANIFFLYDYAIKASFIKKNFLMVNRAGAHLVAALAALCLLFLAGCGTEGSISNSSSVSSPSGIVISASAIPQAVSSGGTSIITVTTLYNSSGAPATGATITAAIGSGGTIDSTSATVGSTGLTVFTVTPSTAVSVTFVVEDVSVTIRINVVA